MQSIEADSGLRHQLYMRHTECIGAADRSTGAEIALLDTSWPYMVDMRAGGVDAASQTRHA